MSLNSKTFKIAMSALFLMTLAECSKGKSKSDGAEFTVLPVSPIVITGDVNDPNGKTIKGPWFNFRLTMKNNTEGAITIVALTAQIFAEDESGQQVTSDFSVNPADFNHTITDVTDCKYFYFGTWAVGEDKSFELTDGQAVCKGVPLMYVGDNKSGSSGKNFRYRVVVKPQGWFGTFDKPLDRFDKQFTFYTQ